MGRKSRLDENQGSKEEGLRVESNEKQIFSSCSLPISHEKSEYVAQSQLEQTYRASLTYTHKRQKLIVEGQTVFARY